MRYLTLLFLSFLSIKGFSQGPPLHPKMEMYPPSTYKEHNQIFSAERDSRGGMWFGTADLVMHFTGEDWEKFPTRKGMGVLALEIDEKGRVWVGGTSSFGFLRVVPPNNSPKKVEQKGKPYKKAGKSDTTRLTKAPGHQEYVSLVHLLPDSLKDFGNVWKIHITKEDIIFNAYNAIFVLKKNINLSSSKKTESGKSGSSKINVIRPKGSFRRSFEVNGEVWIQDRGHGFFRFEPGRNEQVKKDTLIKLPESEAFASKIVSDIIDHVPGVLPAKRENSHESVLIVTAESGLYRYNYEASSLSEEERISPFGKENWSFFKKGGFSGALPLEPSKNPFSACLALSSIKNGVILLDSNGRAVLQLEQEDGMLTNHIWETIRGEPGSGSLWSATDQGIVRWTPGDPRTFAWEGKSFSGSVGDIIRYRGQLFIGTSQGLFLREIKKRSGKNSWRLILEGRCHDLLTIKNSISRKRSFLVANAEKDLIQVRAKKKTPNNRSEQWTFQQVSRKNSYCLTSLPNAGNSPWIGYGGRDGIVLLSKRKEEWIEQLHIDKLPEEVVSLKASPKVSWESKNKGVVLWAGFRTKGGFSLRLDSTYLAQVKQDESLHKVSYEELSEKGKKGITLYPFVGKGKTRKGLPQGEARFFHLRDHIVATTSSGLYRFVKKSHGTFRWVSDTSMGCLFGKCQEKTKEKGVQSVFRLKEDGDGSIWVESEHPYHLIPKNNGEYQIDSLPFKGMNLSNRVFFPERSAITWMGGHNGLMRYDENVTKDFAQAYSCLIRQVTAPLQDTSKEKKDSLLFGGFYRKPAPEDSLLGWKRAWKQPKAFIPTLPYEMNGFTFHYAAPYYENQEKVKYSYRLQGFDKEWSQWKKETRKEYTNLPEGSYTFKVKAKNVYGVESKVAEYQFRILPPWYRTWTAYGGYTIAGIGFIWLLLWLNSRRLVAQKQRLERIVEERTQEIREQKEEVEKQRAVAEEQKQEVEKKNQALEEANETITHQKEEVEEQKEKVEEAHREITASIDYAKKIQNALLQSEEYATEHLPGHFILFKPQATVSGDFFWVKEQKGHLYFAAIDCTGHGVPGAFMSMLGISQLNEIMAARELPTPGEILTVLRKRVVAELSSGDPEEGAKDGMDAALVKIPLEKAPNSKSKSKKIEFAGANNPLYVVKNEIAEAIPEVAFYQHGDKLIGKDHDPSRIKPFKKNSDGFEVKGDKMAVGYEPGAPELFTTAEIEVPPKAMLYLFSDGYADQFGGPKGKKFRYGPFKELLARIHTMTPEDQKEELDRVFEEWKKGQEQVDDVCVVGVRV